jgi:hypothetical protein
MQLPFVHLGRNQGQGIPWVNTAHPLAVGLSAAYAPGWFPSGVISNLVSPTIGDIVTRVGFGSANGQAPGVTPEGPGLAYLATLGGAITVSSQGVCPASWKVASGSSLFVRGQQLVGSATTKASTIFGLTSSTGPFSIYALGKGAAGVPTQAFSLQYSNTTAFNSAPGAITVANGLMYSLAGTFGAGAPGIMYVNGLADVLGSSNPTITSLNYGTGTVSISLGNGNATEQVGSDTTVAYLWPQRVLTPNEISYLDQNPYSLLLWPSDLIMAELVGTSSVVPPATSVFKPMLFSPLMVAGGAMEWLGRRKMTMRRLRGE